MGWGKKREDEARIRDYEEEIGRDPEDASQPQLPG